MLRCTIWVYLQTHPQSNYFTAELNYTTLQSSMFYYVIAVLGKQKRWVIFGLGGRCSFGLLKVVRMLRQHFFTSFLKAEPQTPLLFFVFRVLGRRYIGAVVRAAQRDTNTVEIRDRRNRKIRDT